MSTEQADIQTDAKKAVEATGTARTSPNVTNVVSAGEAALAVERDFAPLAPLVVKESKAGYKTTEFWAGILSSILITVGVIPAPHDAKGYIVGGIAVAYAVARGIAKLGVPTAEPPADPAAGAPSVEE